MPSGRVHEAINLTTLGLMGLAYLATGPRKDLADPGVLAFTMSYLVGTFLITPDLDLAEKRVRAKGRWGVLGVLWWPYGAVFRHRGLSHTWVLGPLTRLVYLALVLYLLWLFLGGVYAYLAGGRLPALLLLPGLPKEVLLQALLGYYLSQWLHLLADGILPDRDLRRRPR
ncbi:metal-binding protein [Thermus filiformis]|uniref:Hydrolase n=1 Tax=Thermus filiformis TaxID=276 RepID=A0A0D6X9X3_THEFI|nr:metal-binding protein [Thermus filiformis]KIX84492.1 hydrolase [Thermus filiformis]